MEKRKSRRRIKERGKKEHRGKRNIGMEGKRDWEANKTTEKREEEKGKGWKSIKEKREDRRQIEKGGRNKGVMGKIKRKKIKRENTDENRKEGRKEQTNGG